MLVTALHKRTNDFYSLRVILVAICCVTIFTLYFLLLRPTSIILAHTSAQSHAMLLLLPSQAVWPVKEVQDFIHANLERS